MILQHSIGTMLRFPQYDARKLDFLASIGIEEIQLCGLTGDWLDHPEQSDAVFEAVAKHGFRVTSQFLSIPDVDWSNHSDIGLIPDAKRAARTALMKRQILIGAAHGVKLVLCHAGAIPPPSDFRYASILDALKELTDCAGEHSMDFVFETGQENAESMERILSDLSRVNAGINLDGANLVIYGSDEPLNFLRRMRPYIRSMHCKDARHARAGETKGRETVLGTGETRFETLLRDLIGGGFRGPLIIERELPPGPEQEQDIANAVKYIQKLLGDEK